MCGAATCDLNHDTRGETEHRGRCGKKGWICAVAEYRCRHDMMKVMLNGIKGKAKQLLTEKGVCV